VKKLLIRSTLFAVGLTAWACVALIMIIGVFWLCDGGVWYFGLAVAIAGGHTLEEIRMGIEEIKG